MTDKFIDSLKKEELEVDAKKKALPTYEEKLIKLIIDAIKSACRKKISEHKFEGTFWIYEYDSGLEEGRISFRSEQEAIKRVEPILKRAEGMSKGYNAIHGALKGNINTQILSKLLKKEISDLGFTNFYYNIITVSDTRVVKDKNGVFAKTTFSGKTLYEFTGQKSYDLFIRIEW